jgi:deoxyribodipyrimidine photo-lyase
MTIQPTRIKILNEAPPRDDGAYVLYWMQQSQRGHFNPALEYAVEEANRRDLPVLVAFGLTDGYPEANARHYAFLLEGLAEAERALRARGIGFVIRRGAPDEVALSLSSSAALVVCDRGYLKPQTAWRAGLAARIDRRLVQVEGDVVVPVEIASPKHEIGARTLRPKLKRIWDPYFAPLDERRVARSAEGLNVRGDIDLSDIPAALAALDIDHSSSPCVASGAARRPPWSGFVAYLDDGFETYAKNRSVPEAGAASHLSSYLHYGQVSPVWMAGA